MMGLGTLGIPVLLPVHRIGSSINPLKCMWLTLAGIPLHFKIMTLELGNSTSALRRMGDQSRFRSATRIPTIDAMTWRLLLLLHGPLEVQD